VAVFDLEGHKTLLGDGSGWALTLAWAPRSDELWYASHPDHEYAVVKALDLRGRTRSIMALPGWAFVHDLASDGRALVVVAKCRDGIRCLPPGETRERDFALFSMASALDLSADGRTLLFSDRGPPGADWTYLRRTDGSAGPVRLGEGTAESLSPDGRWALAATASGGQVLLPVGAGEPRNLDTHGRFCDAALWFPDGRRVLMTCREGEAGRREFVVAVDGSGWRPLAPEGTYCHSLSPDGNEAACVDASAKGWIYPLAGGSARPIQGLRWGETPFQWALDGSLFVLSEAVRLPRRIFRLDPKSGKRTLWKELMPDDPTGIVWFNPYITPDGGTYAYKYQACLGTLYAVDGLR
jgi:Tol biopolymer transport system component